MFGFHSTSVPKGFSPHLSITCASDKGWVPDSLWQKVGWRQKPKSRGEGLGWVRREGIHQVAWERVHSSSPQPAYSTCAFVQEDYVEKESDYKRP